MTAPPASWRPEGFVHGVLTPMHANGDVDYTTLERLVEFHIVACHAPCLCPLLHLGESPSLALEERTRVLDQVAAATRGRVPILVHVSASDTTQQVFLARHAAQTGAAAIVSLAPYCRGLSDELIVQHFVALAAAVATPVIAYSSPGTGHGITPAVVAALRPAGVPLVGLKDASFDLSYASEVCELLLSQDPDFAFMPGIECWAMFRPVGSSTGFSVCASIAPRLVNHLGDAIRSNRWSEAADLQLRASALLNLLLEAYPASVKAAMEIMGRAVGPTRLPVQSFGLEPTRKLESDMAVLEILSSEPHGWP